MTQKFILIVYDISDDRRRTKLHDRLLDFGTPVQYSVFECLLTEKEEKRMMKVVRSVIRPRKDAVRFYPLCVECVQKIVVTCGKEVLHATEKAVVVG